MQSWPTLLIANSIYYWHLEFFHDYFTILGKMKEHYYDVLSIRI